MRYIPPKNGPSRSHWCIVPTHPQNHACSQVFLWKKKTFYKDPGKVFGCAVTSDQKGKKQIKTFISTIRQKENTKRLSSCLISSVFWRSWRYVSCDWQQSQSLHLWSHCPPLGGSFLRGSGVCGFQPSRQSVQWGTAYPVQWSLGLRSVRIPTWTSPPGSRGSRSYWQISLCYTPSSLIWDFLKLHREMCPHLELCCLRCVHGIGLPLQSVNWGHAGVKWASQGNFWNCRIGVAARQSGIYTRRNQSRSDSNTCEWKWWN